MKKTIVMLALLLAAGMGWAQKNAVKSPDGKLAVDLTLDNGLLTYAVSYDGLTALLPSPLGFRANIGDFATGLAIVDVQAAQIDEQYDMNRSKVGHVHYVANELRMNLQNHLKQQFAVVFRVSDNDIAFRYEIPRQGETGSIRIMEETTGFCFPSSTTTFLTPQSDAMIGWKRTKPSYEEVYTADAPLTAKSQYGHGYTFPGLFKVTASPAEGKKGGKAAASPLWVLVSETGVDSRYCGSHLSDCQPKDGGGCYTIALPMAEENNGNGTVEPAFGLPGAMPWRTLTVGASLRPVVETTIPFDNVRPRYESKNEYKFGRGTWSWIVWQDNSINYDDQVRYIDLAKQMGFEYVLVDNWWDTNIGTQRMEQLVKYAQSQGVDVFLWFSSSGYWNDIEQGPINRMDNPIERKYWMRWMHQLGVKGIKVDFFGGDKQETIRLYEAILSDADDNGLMVIFHGCTLPRGWERMYPNYVGSEAVLASENLIFGQGACDSEAFNACLHPFIRNAVGCMEFGGCFMNRRLAKGNKSGTTRRTTDCMELATCVLFQNPIQNFAITPENLLPVEEGGAPQVSMDLLRRMPTTWDETRFIDGYPGKYVVLARRHGQVWYIAGVNAEASARKLTIDLSAFVKKGEYVERYADNLKDQDPDYTPQLRITKPAAVNVTMASNGGFVIIK